MLQCPKCERTFRNVHGLGSHRTVHPHTEEEKAAIRVAYLEHQAGRRGLESIKREFHLDIPAIVKIAGLEPQPEPHPPSAFTPQDFVQAYMDYIGQLKAENEVMAIEIGKLQEILQQKQKEFTALASKVNETIYKQKSWTDQIETMKGLLPH